MVGWHHQLTGYEFEQALGDGEGQGSLACCSPWGCKESDTTEQLNWTDRLMDYNKCTTTSVTFQCCVIFGQLSSLILELLFMNILEHINHLSQFSHSVCPTLWDPMDCSTPGFPVHHQLQELAETHVYRVVMPSNHLILCCPLLLQPSIVPASGSFPITHFFASSGQNIGVSASASVLPMSIQDWFPLGWTGWNSLQSKEPSRVFSNITVQKHQFFDAQLSSQSNSHIHTRPLEKQ